MTKILTATKIVMMMMMMMMMTVIIILIIINIYLYDVARFQITR